MNIGPGVGPRKDTCCTRLLATLEKKSISLSGTLLFDLRNAPRNVAERIRDAFAEDAIYKRKKQLLRDYSAERLYLDKIEPIFRDLL